MQAKRKHYCFATILNWGYSKWKFFNIDIEPGNFLSGSPSSSIWALNQYGQQWTSELTERHIEYKYNPLKIIILMNTIYLDCNHYRSLSIHLLYYRFTSSLLFYSGTPPFPCSKIPLPNGKPRFHDSRFLANTPSHWSPDSLWYLIKLQPTHNYIH